MSAIIEELWTFRDAMHPNTLLTSGLQAAGKYEELNSLLERAAKELQRWEDKPAHCPRCDGDHL